MKDKYLNLDDLLTKYTKACRVLKTDYDSLLHGDVDRFMTIAAFLRTFLTDKEPIFFKICEKMNIEPIMFSASWFENILNDKDFTDNPILAIHGLIISDYPDFGSIPFISKYNLKEFLEYNILTIDNEIYSARKVIFNYASNNSASHLSVKKVPDLKRFDLVKYSRGIEFNEAEKFIIQLTDYILHFNNIIFETYQNVNRLVDALKILEVSIRDKYNVLNNFDFNWKLDSNYQIKINISNDLIDKLLFDKEFSTLSDLATILFNIGDYPKSNSISKILLIQNFLNSNIIKILYIQYFEEKDVDEIVNLNSKVNMSNYDEDVKLIHLYSKFYLDCFVESDLIELLNIKRESCNSKLYYQTLRKVYLKLKDYIKAEEFFNYELCLLPVSPKLLFEFAEFYENYTNNDEKCFNLYKLAKDLAKDDILKEKAQKKYHEYRLKLRGY